MSIFATHSAMDSGVNIDLTPQNEVASHAVVEDSPSLAVGGRDEKKSNSNKRRRSPTLNKRRSKRSSSSRTRVVGGIQPAVTEVTLKDAGSTPVVAVVPLIPPDNVDELQCTYSQGYLQQPVFSCLTCATTNNGGADDGAVMNHVCGVCEACRWKCHADHAVLELWEKRHFRCDCPTARSTITCPMLDFDVKDRKNEENVYNHNFFGRYCICNGYDEPDKVMYQCTLCEDWFHDQCIGPLPGTMDNNDMICPVCVDKLPFLEASAYGGVNFLALMGKREASEGVVFEDSKDSLCVFSVSGFPLRDMRVVRSISLPGPLFFQKKLNWRDSLCKCDQCMMQYEKLGVLYLAKEPKPQVDIADDINIEEEKEEGSDF